MLEYSAVLSLDTPTVFADNRFAVNRAALFDYSLVVR